MDRPTLTFRQAQAAFDLCCILREIDDIKLFQLGGAKLKCIIHGSACRFENDEDIDCYEAVTIAALNASKNTALAVGVLVANALQKGLWLSETYEFAEIASEKIQSASPILQSAILRGLDTLARFSYPHKRHDTLLPKLSRLTWPRDFILSKLCEVARRMDEPTQQRVAAADYGWEAEEHLKALQSVLSANNCQFSKKGWHPREVVSLVSHVPGKQGFLSCTALLLANAVMNNDDQSDFDFRLERFAKDYNLLPDSVRSPILSGLRYLYESKEDFMTYSDGNYDLILSPRCLIPYFDTPSSSAETSQN